MGIDIFIYIYTSLCVQHTPHHLGCRYACCSMCLHVVCCSGACTRQYIDTGVPGRVRVHYEPMHYTRVLLLHPIIADVGYVRGTGAGFAGSCACLHQHARCTCGCFTVSGGMVHEPERCRSQQYMCMFIHIYLYRYIYVYIHVYIFVCAAYAPPLGLPQCMLQHVSARCLLQRCLHQTMYIYTGVPGRVRVHDEPMHHIRVLFLHPISTDAGFACSCVCLRQHVRGTCGCFTFSCVIVHELERCRSQQYMRSHVSSPYMGLKGVPARGPISLCDGRTCVAGSH
jgi:hypothetical protein